MDPYKILGLVEGGHQVCHDMPQDFDVMLNVAFTERDFVFVCMALALINVTFPCLDDLNYDLQERMRELLEVQQPTWMKPQA